MRLSMMHLLIWGWSSLSHTVSRCHSLIILNSHWNLMTTISILMNKFVLIWSRCHIHSVTRLRWHRMMISDLLKLLNRLSIIFSTTSCLHWILKSSIWCITTILFSFILIWIKHFCLKSLVFVIILQITLYPSCPCIKCSIYFINLSIFISASVISELRILILFVIFCCVSGHVVHRNINIAYLMLIVNSHSFSIWRLMVRHFNEK